MPRFTSQQLSDLRALIATGAKSVNRPDQGLVARDLDEMLKLEQIMASDVAGTNSSSNSSSRTSYASYSRD